MKKFFINFAFTLTAIISIQVVAEIAKTDWVKFTISLLVFALIDTHSRLKKAESVLFTICNTLLDTHDKKQRKKAK